MIFFKINSTEALHRTSLPGKTAGAVTVFSLIITLMIPQLHAAQEEQAPVAARKKIGVSGGVFYGGGFLGGEIEYLFFPHIAPTLGIGSMGYNGGLNFHLHDSVDSHYLNLGFVDMGFEPEKSVQIAELSANIRFKSHIEASVGGGWVFHQGEEFDRVYRSITGKKISTFILTYSFGYYWTF